MALRRASRSRPTSSSLAVPFDRVRGLIPEALATRIPGLEPLAACGLADNRRPSLVRPAGLPVRPRRTRRPADPVGLQPHGDPGPTAGRLRRRGPVLATGHQRVVRPAAARQSGDPRCGAHGACRALARGPAAKLLRWWVVTEHGRPSRSGRASRRSGPRSRRRSTASSWPATGPRPAGRPRWKAPSAAATLLPRRSCKVLDRPTRLVRPGLKTGTVARWLFGSAEFSPTRSPVASLEVRFRTSLEPGPDRSPLNGYSDRLFGRKVGTRGASAATIYREYDRRGRGSSSMRGGSSPDVLRHLRTLYRCGVVGPLGDEQLLDRFLAHRDEAAEEAFAELVQRHGPMVLGVCRRVLGDAHEAEDAFQATFLVLARKALRSSVGRKSPTGSTGSPSARPGRPASAQPRRRIEGGTGEHPDSRRAPRRGLPRRTARHPGRGTRPAAGAVPGPGGPVRARRPLRTEAARRLDIPEGTLSSRLSRAKARLRDRLARRGVTVPSSPSRRP